MSYSFSLSKSELPVLMNVFSAASRAITGETLYKKYPSVADDLINNGWLNAREKFLSIIINGEEKKVIWRPEVGEYQFYSLFLGWTTVPENRLKRYEVNLRQCFLWLLEAFDIHPTSRASVLIDNYLYDLGFTKLNGRLVKIYLCARFKRAKVYVLVNNFLKNQPKHYPIILVTDTASVSPICMSSKIIEVTFSSLLKPNVDYCEIDRSILASFSECGTDGKNKKIVSFSDDYRLVEWDGIKYKLTKKQAAIIEALHKSGGKSHKDFLQAQANTDNELHRIMRNRVGGKWVQHPLWNTLIKKAGSGYYHFNESADFEEALYQH